MDQKTIGIYLSRILSGFYTFIYNNKKYKLIYPDISIKYESELYAQQEYEYSRFNEWITEDIIIDTLVNLGLWTYGGDEHVKNLEKQIEDQKIELYQNFLNPPKLKNIRKSLSNLKKNYNKLLSVRHSLDQYTLEGYTNLLKNQYLLVHSLYDSKNNLIFDSLENTDYALLSNLSAVISNNMIEIPDFRMLARSDLWRNYWSANSEQLFDKPTINWTDEQKTLVVLTKMYDNAYQHPECPSEKVIEDDDMFDGWLLLQKKESEKQKNKNRTEKMLEGKNLGKAGEIFVMANSQEEAQQIYDLNDNTSRHIIKERHSTIINSGADISDADLPDNKRNIVVQSNQMFKESRK